MSIVIEISNKSSESHARSAAIKTRRGEIQTPAFMPVGTQATVKAMTVDELDAIGTELIVCNTYHLMIRPGEDVVSKLGGLHRFMNWPRPILTDSGGFQAFSLATTNKLEAGGIRFRSHVDGTEFFLSPARSIEIQLALDSDILMPLDECTAYPVTAEEAARSMELSLRWEEASLEYFRENAHEDKALFGIVQGSIYPDLRRQCLDELLEMQKGGRGFDGIALGGLAIGEPPDETRKIVAEITPLIPEDKPRYLMGMGTPEDLVEGVAAGTDLFDCVLPTRLGRNGKLFTARGEINICNAAYQRDERPIDPDCPCTSCRHYSRGYLRHLYQAKEILASRLGTLHNLVYYLNLMRQMRDAIRDDRFGAFKEDFYETRACGID